MAAINLNVDQMRAWLSEQEAASNPKDLLRSLTVAREGNQEEGEQLVETHNATSEKKGITRCCFKARGSSFSQMTTE